MPALTIDTNTTAFITLPEVMKNANVSNADTGALAELDLMREAAQDIVEGIIGPVLWRTVTEQVPVTESTYAYQSGGMVALTYRPVVSVTSIGVVGLPGSTVTYALDAATGSLTGVQPWAWTIGRNVTVTYVAGRTTCPAAIRLAALIIATHLWQTQLGNEAPVGGVFEAETPLETTMAAGYAIPNRAMELLAPYRSTTILIA